jgi:hypothetical protein
MNHNGYPISIEWFDVPIGWNTSNIQLFTNNHHNIQLNEINQIIELDFDMGIPNKDDLTKAHASTQLSLQA